jgi:predicted nucleotidyltransferase
LTFERITSKKLLIEVRDKLVSDELSHIMQCSQLSQVWLFGSAARNQLTEASDLDFILTFPNTDALKNGRKTYFSLRRKKTFPTDVMFILQSEFDRLSVLGGVCFVCKSEGQLLFQRNTQESVSEFET